LPVVLYIYIWPHFDGQGIHVERVATHFQCRRAALGRKRTQQDYIREDTRGIVLLKIAPNHISVTLSAHIHTETCIIYIYYDIYNIYIYIVNKSLGINGLMTIPEYGSGYVIESSISNPTFDHGLLKWKNFDAMHLGSSWYPMNLSGLNCPPVQWTPHSE
jgi:hypothetical protein